MTNDEVLKELKTIRTLLAIDKEEDLRELTTELSETQEHIMQMLSYSEWRSIPTSDVADELDIVNRTVQEHRSELEEMNLINKRGKGGGTEYRITGLYRAAESLGIVDVSQ